jgi:hypothetical protein
VLVLLLLLLLAEAAAALLAQIFLCFFQSAFWHSREQYCVVWHFAQYFKLIPGSDSDFVLAQCAQASAIVVLRVLCMCWNIGNQELMYNDFLVMAELLIRNYDNKNWKLWESANVWRKSG